MSHPIEDYGIIGDTHTTALVHRAGSIDWLCWPRHDSPALFLRLLDDDKGGYCEIVFREPVQASRRYLPETNVLETTFVIPSGRVVLTDFMPVSPPSTLQDVGPDGEGESRIVRHLRCEEGIVAGAFRTRPTFDYARRPAEARTKEDRSIEYRCRLDTVLVHAGGPMRLDGDVAVASFELAAGAETFLVVSHDGEAHPQAEPSTLPDLDAVKTRLDQTRSYWESWSGKCTYRGRYREAVLRSILCLKLLTYSPTGAIIAAATACLPEAVPGNRNYDYRFSWIRDASFTVVSFVYLGYIREAAEYLRFLRESEPSKGKKLSIYYPIDGDVTAPQRLDHLSGWNGVGPLHIGNEAAGQEQNDIFGEFLMALHVWLEAVDYDPPEKANDHLPEVIFNLAENVLARRDIRDSGIWELRGEGRELLHSKAMIALALECATEIGRRIGLKDESALRRWEEGAKSMRAEYQARGWNEKRQAYTMGYGMDELDAAVLRVTLFGAFDIEDPRLQATMSAIDRELVSGDLVYRYRMDDGMTGDEATFAPCAFWRVGCMALSGKTEEARELFERLLTRGNDLGLYAEEIDAATGAQRGNFPQAFTHMAIINHAVRLERQMDKVETAEIEKLLRKD